MRCLTSAWYRLAALLLVALVSCSLSRPAHATSQWSKKTGMACASCHTVFPRLNATGARYLENGYQVMSAHEPEEKYDTGDVYLQNVNHLLGFRLNMTPLQMETNSLLVDSTGTLDKQTRYTIGSPVWVQFFAAGNIYRNLSFFSELEFSQSSFKFNWFYFNFTNLFETPAVNFQVGNVSPLEFASFPNRLPQLPAIKGEVFLVKASNGKGEESVDMSSARPGLQWFGHSPWALAYAGVSPGPSARDNNQFLQGWAGIVGRLPEGQGGSFAGSNATVHFYTGTDTKNTGRLSGQIENRFRRLSPQLNVRWNDKLDLQAAYVLGHDDNWSLVAAPTSGFDFDGVAVEAGYLLGDNVHAGVHYDKFQSDEIAGVRVLDYERVVPALTYIINQNFRASVYYEHDLTDKPEELKSQKAYVNLRCMF